MSSFNLLLKTETKEGSFFLICRKKLKQMGPLQRKNDLPELSRLKIIGNIFVPELVTFHCFRSPSHFQSLNCSTSELITG